MKKHFLLTTTALLLGTSNVMAAELDTKAEIQVTANIHAASYLGVMQHLDFGNFLVALRKVTPGTLIASSSNFTLSPNTEVVEVSTKANQQVIGVLEYVGTSPISNVGALKFPTTIKLTNGLELKNIYATSQHDASTLDSGEYYDNIYFSGDLYASETENVTAGQATGSLLVTFNYD